MADLVIVGTSHCFQRGVPDCSEEQETGFIRHLLAVGSIHSVTQIAEEYSQEHIALQPRGNSTCHTAAGLLGCSHLYCDPNSSERSELGIKSPQEIQVDSFLSHRSEEDTAAEILSHLNAREQFWLTRITQSNRFPSIFVCGANHVDSLCEAAENIGLDVLVEDRDWVA